NPVAEGRVGVGEDLVGKASSGGIVLPVKGFGGQRAKRDDAVLRVGNEGFQPSACFGDGLWVGRLKAQDGDVELMQLVGWLEFAGFQKMGFGVGELVKLNGAFGGDDVKGRVLFRIRGEAFQGSSREREGGIFEAKGAGGEIGRAS